ncbi:MAG: lysophospholipid acyltransferase family protein, partial [Bacteroidota bacterium]
MESRVIERKKEKSSWWEKGLGYFLTPIHLFLFGGLLLIFDVVQRIFLAIGGYSLHKRSVDVLNLGLMRSLWALGIHCRFEQPYDLPKDRPLLVVANHQSMYDIPPFFWHLRRHHIKFVAKKELGKGVPSISFNLRKGGNVLIDRKDSSQAVEALTNFARFIEENNYAAVIFPEGTRSRTGVPKKFSTTGLKTLLTHAPSAIVLPVTIN